MEITRSLSQPDSMVVTSVPRPGWPRWLLARVIWVVTGALLGAAAVQKALDLEPLLRVLQFDGVPRHLAVPLARGIVIAEAGLGAALLLLIRPIETRVAAIALLILFTVQLGALSMSAKAPDCGCVKLWKAHESAQRENLFSLLRNSLLLSGLVWARPSIVCHLQYPRIDSRSGAPAGPRS